MANPLTPRSDQRLLTPVLEFPTEVPAPKGIFKKDTTDSGAVTADGNTKIVLNACSEFHQETVPLNALDATKKLRLVQDAANQPLLLTMGNDKKLYCTIRVEGSPQGWKVFPITPKYGTETVLTFDALKLIDNTIVIATAIREANGDAYLYVASLPTFTCAWDATQKRVTGFDPLLPWRQIANSTGPKDISSITLAPTKEQTSRFQLIVGTEASDDRVGSHYVVVPDATDGQLWREVPVPESARRILDTAPANIWEGPGVYTLYERFDHSSGCTFDSLKGSFHYRMPISNIGTAHGIFANANPWNMTDLFVAGTKGLAFFNFAHPDMPPQLILPGRGILQVVSNEAVDIKNPTTQTKIVAFAVTEQQELLYFEGIRPYETNVVQFTTSGYPIAVDVDEVSTMYNLQQDACELMYLGSGTNDVWHLAKSSGAIAWTSSQVLVDGPSGLIKYPAYTTSLTLLRDDDKPVGADYPVKVSSDEMVHATVNGRSHIIGPNPSTFYTDVHSLIKIVVPVDDSLGGPHYSVTLDQLTATPKTLIVSSAQRVLRMLGDVKGPDDLSKAVSTDGRKVFNKTEDQYKDTSSLISNFPSMLSSTDSSLAEKVLATPAPAPTDFSFGYKRNDDGSTTIDDGSWLEHAVEILEHEIADVLAWIKAKVKAVVKFAVKAIGKVVMFAWSIAGKVIKFMARTVGTLVRSVANFLKDYLGVDITGFLDWLSFIFDVEKVKATQQDILNIYTATKGFTTSFMETESSALKQKINESTDSLKKYIKDTRPPMAKDTNKNELNDIFNSPLSKGLDFLFNNPIGNLITKYNPVTMFTDIVEESILEEISGFGINLSHVFDKISDVIQKFISAELTTLTNLITALRQNFLEIAKDPSRLAGDLAAMIGDVFWTAVDLLKNLLFSLLDSIVAVFETAFDLVEAPWNLGWLTDLFTDWAGQPFTLVNVSTFVMAQILNIVCLCTIGKLPSEVIGDSKQIMAWLSGKPQSSIMANMNFHVLSLDGPKKPVAKDVPVADLYDYYSMWSGFVATSCAAGSSIVGLAVAITNAKNGKMMATGPDEVVGWSDLFKMAPAETEAVQILSPEMAANVVQLLFDVGQCCARGFQLGITVLCHDQDPNAVKGYESKRDIQIAGLVVNVVDMLVRIVSIGNSFRAGTPLPPNVLNGLNDILNAFICVINMIDYSFSLTHQMVEEGDQTYAAVSGILSAAFAILASGGSAVLGLTEFKSPHLMAATGVCGAADGFAAFGCGVFTLHDAMTSKKSS